MNYADFSWCKSELPWLKARTIFLAKSGSHAYGTHLPDSDVDLKGICIPPREYYLGNLQHFEQSQTTGAIDATVYGINKFFQLAADCNPNIIEILFTDESDWIIPSMPGWRMPGWRVTDLPWRRIHEKRDLFLSQKAKHTFSGYAVAQLRRIETHRHWLLNPVQRQPTREDFGLPANDPTLGKEQLGVINARIRKMEDDLGGKGFTKDQVETQELQMIAAVAKEGNISSDLVEVIIKERRYSSAMRNWTAYLGWKNERNPKRAELEAKFGYDTKHAMHLVRLLLMAEEILSTGKVIVKRPDAELLLSIRAGAIPYEDVIEFARWKEAGLELIQSPLPHSPNRVAIDHLLMGIVEWANF
jgi:predicted nucleotidyltransferase